MADIFSLVGRVSIEYAQAETALERVSDAAEDTADNLEEVGDVSDEAGGKTEKSSSRMSSAFKKIGAAVVAAFAVDKIIDFGKAVVDASATVAAEQSAFEQIMGDYSDTAQKKINEIADTTGMVSTRLTPYMTSMTAKFKGLGYDIDDATTLAQSGLTLAADAAAFWDKSLDDSMGALNSFINGSYEGGEAIGLFANDTQLASYAVKQGIVKESKAWSELDEAKKQATRLQYAQDMMKASGATGQAAKESDQYANVQANLNEKWRQFKAQIGEPILQNVVIPAMGHVSGLVDKLSGGFDRLKNSSNVVKEMGTMFSELVAKVQAEVPKVVAKASDMMKGIGETIKNNLPSIISKGLDMIQGLATTIAENVPILISSGMNMLKSIAQGIVDSLPTLIQKVPQIVITIANTISSAIPMILVKGAEIVWELIKGIIGAIPDLIANLPKIAEAIFAVWNAINWWNLGKNLMTGLWNGIKSLGGKLKSNVKQLFTNLKTSVDDIFLSLKNSALNIWNGIKSGISSIVTGIKNFAIGIFNALRSGISGIFNGIKTLSSSIWNGIKSVISGAITGAKNIVMNIVNGIKSGVSGVWNGIKSVTSSVWNGIKSAITSPMTTAKNLVKGIIDSIKGFFNFKIKWPHIPLPHFSIKPKGWGIDDLLKGKIPSLGISWYAKGGIFDEPTIFPTSQGFKGVGEAGAEAVTPINVLLDYVRTAVREENGNVSYKLEQLIKLLEFYLPEIIKNMIKNIYLDTGVLVGELGDAIDHELGNISKMKERGM